MDNKLDVDLKFPIQTKDSATISKITMSRPTFSDMKIASKEKDVTEHKIMKNLLSNIATLLPAEVDELDPVDYDFIAKSLESWLLTDVKVDKGKSMNRSVTIDLKFPIQHASKTYSSVEIKRPKMGQIEQSEQEDNELGQSAKLLQLCSGLSKEVINKMEFGTDFKKSAEYLKVFMMARR